MNKAPLIEQILIMVLGPPIMASLIWLFSHGWAVAIQGGTTSEETRKRQKLLFWFVLIYLYVMLIGVFGYAWLAGK